MSKERWILAVGAVVCLLAFVGTILIATTGKVPNPQPIPPKDWEKELVTANGIVRWVTYSKNCIMVDLKNEWYSKDNIRATFIFGEEILRYYQPKVGDNLWIKFLWSDALGVEKIIAWIKVG